jgi:hypothetical protein
MKRIFIAMVAVVLAAGLTPASAAGMHGGGGAGGGGMHVGGTHAGVSGIRGLRAAPTPREPNMQSRIPAPLPAPTQPPAINGPLNSNGMPSMGNGL